MNDSNTPTRSTRYTSTFVPQKIEQLAPLDPQQVDALPNPTPPLRIAGPFPGRSINVLDALAKQMKDAEASE